MNTRGKIKNRLYGLIILAATRSEFKITITNPIIIEILELLTALISSFRSFLVSVFMTFILIINMI
jgi:hypothetical protein